MRPQKTNFNRVSQKIRLLQKIIRAAYTSSRGYYGFDFAQ